MFALTLAIGIHRSHQGFDLHGSGPSVAARDSSRTVGTSVSAP
jgi:hypothetical protein